ncbi:aspartate carbamoyltransferase [Actinomycetaceae bacterium MB13-C1-2]|nr:aspartate carbamoyltransferase [Actinomycetaceae bacterium MB13-C1-2]
MRHLIDIRDFSKEEIDELLGVAERIIADPIAFQDRCAHKRLATLFFEPSTRTRLSFEAAMQALGGSVLGFSSADSSSAAKGESVTDTVRTVACYADIIAMRHPKEGAPFLASRRSTVPVINAGDGGHNHPTQTLTDLLTIHREKGRLDNLKIGMAGDLKFGRTVHSLITAMLQYEGISFVLMSPPELRIPSYLREMLDREGVPYLETDEMEAHLGDLDILYMTRVQKERFFNEEDYVRLKDRFILDTEKMQYAAAEMKILHPLPRVNEISVKVDDDPRAVYFDQVKNGMIVRMALILKLLDEAGKESTK